MNEVLWDVTQPWLATSQNSGETYVSFCEWRTFDLPAAQSVQERGATKYTFLVVKTELNFQFLDRCWLPRSSNKLQCHALVSISIRVINGRVQSTFLLWFKVRYNNLGGTRWRSWLRHCATSRKVAGSIPDGVTAIFHWLNPSGRTVTLRSTQPLTEMSTRNISWG